MIQVVLGFMMKGCGFCVRVSAQTGIWLMLKGFNVHARSLASSECLVDHP